MTRLSDLLPGTWELRSRIDHSIDGSIHPDPALGPDPVAWLIYDRAGHFAAQFMKRDRSTPMPDAPAAPGANNSRARGGYDAYFGTYAVDDDAGEVTQRLVGAMSPENVGHVLTRAMQAGATELVIRLDTTAWDGTPVTRTLTWQRIAPG